MSESRSITSAELREMLTSVAETLAEEEPYLNSLDAAIGDGDHGITMRVGFKAISSKLSSLPGQIGIGAILKEAGTAFMTATGGAIGILLGRMLTAAGTVVEAHQEIGPAEFQMILAAMERALSSTGKARPGDKTILDAVHAANEAASGLEASPQDLLLMVRQASEAANKAAQNTAQMLARIGRSSRLGDRVLGHPDPGAVSFSIILRAMTEWLERQRQHKLHREPTK